MKQREREGKRDRYRHTMRQRCREMVIEGETGKTETVAKEGGETNKQTRNEGWKIQDFSNIRK